MLNILKGSLTIQLSTNIATDSLPLRLGIYNLTTKRAWVSKTHVW